SKGAGAEMRRTLGTAVFSGMIGVTLFGIVLTPVFFFSIDWLGESRLFASRFIRRVSGIFLDLLGFRPVRKAAAAVAHHIAVVQSGNGARIGGRRSPVSAAESEGNGQELPNNGEKEATKSRPEVPSTEY